MNKVAIVEKIQDFLVRAFPQAGVPLRVSTNLLDDYFVDSFGIIETVLFLEEAFQVKVTRAEINGENFRNIDSLATFVAAKMPTANVSD